MREFIESISPGKHWHLDVHGKSAGRPGYAVATEVVRTEYGYTMDLFGARRVRVMIDGAVTAKKGAAALDAVRAELAAKGLIVATGAEEAA